MSRAEYLANAAYIYRFENSNRTPPWEKAPGGPSLDGVSLDDHLDVDGSGPSAPPGQPAGGAAAVPASAGALPALSRKQSARDADGAAEPGAGQTVPAPGAGTASGGAGGGASGAVAGAAALGQPPKKRVRTASGSDPTVPKRPRGRPRKHPLPDPNAPPKKIGRPRKHPVPVQPDLPRGRPPRAPRGAAGDAAARGVEVAAPGGAAPAAPPALPPVDAPEDGSGDEDEAMAAAVGDCDVSDGDDPAAEEDCGDMPGPDDTSTVLPELADTPAGGSWEDAPLALCDPGSDADLDDGEFGMCSDADAPPLADDVAVAAAPAPPPASAPAQPLAALASEAVESPPDSTQAADWDDSPASLDAACGGALSPWRAVGALADTLLGGMTSSPGFVHGPRGLMGAGKGPLWSSVFTQQQPPGGGGNPGVGPAARDDAAAPSAEAVGAAMLVAATCGPVAGRQGQDGDLVVTPPSESCGGGAPAGEVAADIHAAGDGGDGVSPIGRLPLPRALEHLFDAVRPEDAGCTFEAAPSPEDQEGGVAGAAHSHGGRQRSPPPPERHTGRNDAGGRHHTGSPPVADSALAMLAEETIALQSPPPAAPSAAAHAPHETAAAYAMHNGGVATGARAGVMHARMSLDGEVTAALNAAAAAAQAAAAASVAARQQQQAGAMSTPLGSGGAAGWRTGKTAGSSAGLPPLRLSMPPSAGGSSRSSRGSYLALLAATAPPPVASLPASTATAMALVPVATTGRPGVVAADEQDQSPLSVLTTVSSPSYGNTAVEAAPGGSGMLAGGARNMGSAPRGILKATPFALVSSPPEHGSQQVDALLPGGGAACAAVCARDALLALHEAYEVLAQAVAHRLSLPPNSDVAIADGALAAALAGAKGPAARAREEAARLAVVATPDVVSEPPVSHPLRYSLSGGSAFTCLPPLPGGAGMRKAVRFAAGASLEAVKNI